jgi:DNA replication protein DnaC
LVLDDLGAEYKGRNEGMSWSEGELYKIINYRYTNRLSTVLTTNVKPSELDARVADRIRDTGTGLSKLFVENLPSYRTAK